MSNKQVISKWFYLYSDDIYQFLFYRLHSKHYDVEDLVQEVFFRALRNLDKFKGEAAPKTWLYSIARNVAIDAHRKRKRDKWKWLLTFESEKVPENMTMATPEELYFISVEQKELLNAIRSLKESYQEVLIMRAIKDLTVQETSAALGWTENKVRSTLHRAKLALQTKLGGDGHE
ncbi:RNA polymerase sigma factor [Sutcliffiella horikoshii]|uniref:RNA polymerase sigma factor n=1 Tax=Sutcliffiella horikoshii TaxID=79883 RepID=UPI001F1BB810|nr:RNA polymerase sigma factor [Sutcliffiella horikoshii]MCG1022547.1 RNA polymerase sigma factor [Sutcliffiella horikoshii]